MNKNKIATYGSLTMIFGGAILLIIDIIRAEGKLFVGTILSRVSFIVFGLLLLYLNKKNNNVE